MKGGIRIGHFFRRRQRRTSPLERPNDDPDDQTQNNERDLTWTHAQSQSNGQHIANLEPSPDVVGEEDIHQGKKKKKFSNPLYENLLAKGVVGKYVEDVDPDQQNTFCVITKRIGSYNVHRFNAFKSLHLFKPTNPIRKAAIKITTNQYPF
ncbi:Sodium channel protein 60E [Trichoplax sp. H2]|nr:Sodium channel protein 60E [Trichoplax sp. H2]|eukprot:RDD37668.1 Sodium channel protein 60E [Trichoplax sp. H2]